MTNDLRGLERLNRHDRRRLLALFAFLAWRQGLPGKGGQLRRAALICWGAWIYASWRGVWEAWLILAS